MSDIDRETRPAGRDLSLLVFGDTAAEIELTALDKARAFFGDDVHLECEYQAFPVIAGVSTEDERLSGKTYRATVTVRTIKPTGGQS